MEGLLLGVTSRQSHQRAARVACPVLRHGVTGQVLIATVLAQSLVARNPQRFLPLIPALIRSRLLALLDLLDESRDSLAVVGIRILQILEGVTGDLGVLITEEATNRVFFMERSKTTRPVVKTQSAIIVCGNPAAKVR